MPKEQLFFGRIDWCVRAQHAEGSVTEDQAAPKLFSQPEAEKWETDKQQDLRRLAWVLEKLVEITKRSKHRSIVVVSAGKPEGLEVYESLEKIEALPKEVVEKL